MGKSIGIAILMVWFLLLTGCVPEAPHLNPVDPYFNPQNNNEIVFTGEVLKKNDPHLPIEGCLVLLMPEQLFDTTDARGRFHFSNLQKDVHQIIVSKTGFTTDTFTVNIDTVQSSPLHFFLNGNPLVKKMRVFSEYIDQWWPDPITFINFQLIVDDPDGLSDIESLQLQIPSASLDTLFQSTVRPDSFVLRLTDPDFPGNDPFQIIGKDVWILLKDKAGVTVIDGPYHLIRIIDHSPTPIEPVSLQSVDPQPVFRWQPYVATFSFTYEISVFVVQGGIPVLIYGDQQLPTTQLDYQYPDSLPTGTYFWTVGVRDDLGNFSRSKEASFVVP